MLCLQLSHLVELENLLLELRNLAMHVVDVWVDWSTLKLLHLIHAVHHWGHLHILHASEWVHVHHWVVLLLLLLVLKKLLALSIVHAASHPWVSLLQVFVVLGAGALKVGDLRLLLSREIGQVLSQLFAV